MPLDGTETVLLQCTLYNTEFNTFGDTAHKERMKWLKVERMNDAFGWYRNCIVAVYTV